MGPKSNDQRPYKETQRDRDVDIWREDGHVKEEAETVVMQPHAKDR